MRRPTRSAILRSHQGTLKLQHELEKQHEEHKRSAQLDSIVNRVLHTGGRVRAICFSLDSTTLVAGGQDRAIMLHDCTTGVLRSQRPCSDVVLALDISADGRMIASGGSDGQVVLSALLTGQHMRRISHAAAVRSIRFTPDGNAIAIGGDNGTVSLRHTSSSEAAVISEFEFGRMDRHSHTGAAATSAWQRPLPPSVQQPTLPQQQLLQSPQPQLHQQQSQQTQQTQWPIPKQSQQPPQPQSSVWPATPSSPQLTSPTQLAPPQAPPRQDSSSDVASIEAIAFSPSGRQLCAGSSMGSSGHGMVTVCDARTGEVWWQHTVLSGGVSGLAASLDGLHVACAGGGRVTWHAIHPVDRSSRQQAGKPLWEAMHSLERPRDAPRAVAVSPDGRLLASAGGRSVVLRLASSGDVVRELRQVGPMWCCLFSPDGAWLACGGDEPRITLRALGIPESTHTLPAPLRPSPLHPLQISPDGCMLASSDHCAGRLTSLVPGTSLGAAQGEDEVRAPTPTLPMHSAAVSAVAFSADGAIVATGALAGPPDGSSEVLLHSTATGSLLGSIRLEEGATCLVFSPEDHGGSSQSCRGSGDGDASFRSSMSGSRRLLIGEGPELLMYTVTGATATDSGPAKPAEPVERQASMFTAFSNDAEAAARVLEATLLWNDTYRGSVASAAFSSDGELVAVGSGPVVHLCEVRSAGSEIRSLEHTRIDDTPLDVRQSTAYGISLGSVSLVALALSINAAMLATAGTDGRIVLFDVATGEVLREFEPRGTVASLAFSPEPATEGSTLLLWGGSADTTAAGSTEAVGEATLVDVRTEETVWSSGPLHGCVSAVGFVPARPPVSTARLVGAADGRPASANSPRPPKPDSVPSWLAGAGVRRPHFQGSGPMPSNGYGGTNGCGGSASNGSLVLARPVSKVGVGDTGRAGTQHYRSEVALLVASIRSDGVTSITRRALSNPASVAFWATKPPDASLLASALSPQLLSYDVSPSGRSLLAIQCAVRNAAWISSLYALRPPLGISLLVRDVSGRHALDHALANRQSKVLMHLLQCVVKVPPRARCALVEAPVGVPPFLPLLAEQYPKLAADFLAAIGLDAYPPSPNCPPYTRAPSKALTCDDGTSMLRCLNYHDCQRTSNTFAMAFLADRTTSILAAAVALIGWATSTPTENLWEELTHNPRLWVGQVPARPGAHTPSSRWVSCNSLALVGKVADRQAAWVRVSCFRRSIVLASWLGCHRCSRRRASGGEQARRRLSFVPLSRRSITASSLRTACAPRLPSSGSHSVASFGCASSTSLPSF